MNIEEWNIQADLSMAAIEEVFGRLNPEQPCVVILRVAACNFSYTDEALTILKPIDGVYAHTFVDASYEGEEWSLECRDKLIHCEGA